MNFDPRDFNDDSFVVAFGGPATTINVYTISEALTGLADALRAINDIVNPDSEFEIEIEGTGEGSFLVKLRTKKTYRTILRRVVEPIVLGLLVNYMYEQATYRKPTYTIQGEELVVETSKETIKLPGSFSSTKRRWTRAAKSPRRQEGDRGRPARSCSQLHRCRTRMRRSVAVQIPREELDRIITALEKVLVSPQRPLEDAALPNKRHAISSGELSWSSLRRPPTLPSQVAVDWGGFVSPLPSLIPRSSIGLKIDKSLLATATHSTSNSASLNSTIASTASGGTSGMRLCKCMVLSKDRNRTAWSSLRNRRPRPTMQLMGKRPSFLVLP